MSKKIATIEHVIVFDIDSTSVGASVVRCGKDVSGALLERNELFSLRKYITNGNEYPFERFFHQTLQTLKSVAQETQLHALVPVQKVLVNVAVPWSSVQKQIITYQKKKPFIVTEVLLDELLAQRTAGMFEHNREFIEHDVEVVDHRVLDVYGNGYPLRNAIGKEMSYLELHTLASVMSRETKQTFTKTVEAVFHQTPEFVSNTFVCYQGVQSYLPHVNNAIVVDISGEVTEVLVIRDDHLENMGSIPVGLHHMIRSLRDHLNVPIEKAHSLMRLDGDDYLDDHYKMSIETALHDAFGFWFKAFYNLLDQYARNGLLPHTIVLKSPQDTLEWCRVRILKEDRLKEHMHASGRIELITFNQPEKKSDDIELALVSSVLAHL
ncbi:cell division FtsA domain-containing protein [Patescibacteria group bacterium]|nr:cell division FtsA domain-containing protein [Patescibacteria group bacterium]